MLGLPNAVSFTRASAVGALAGLAAFDMIADERDDHRVPYPEWVPVLGAPDGDGSVPIWKDARLGVLAAGFLLPWAPFNKPPFVDSALFIFGSAAAVSLVSSEVQRYSDDQGYFAGLLGGGEDTAAADANGDD